MAAKNLSVFDAIGPRMVGPSSSHTAGAARIALVGRKIVKGRIKEVQFFLHGSFSKTYKGHGTDRALLGGILGYSTEDPRIVDAYAKAKEEGISYSFIPTDLGDDYHPNTVKMLITNEAGVQVEVIGESIGGGSINIVQLNGLRVEFTGEFYTLIVKQRDVPGVAAHITQCIASEEINVAFMRIYREEKGNVAYTVIEADEEISASAVEKIKEKRDLIKDAFIVSLR
ncbi:L-serine ammonia-lyase, iron-sulfur-dependent subunit beta [Anaerotalea alkaliphila]|uniref:L-serine deaminase n=1 Tax=Anaerotalea alkaliphila TaxID=2662126 RepID=A0A7X5HUT5_9FIRM|nr:L-serine ammonia-lyase, iron-sulfur-dependent subunit beta [Anaerotalea alkaliphila]NDL67044.1 L-serine ammonia-lyase, iron-sulfur-dependent, subunit beta [Anaerotalea alkaliphila]